MNGIPFDKIDKKVIENLVANKIPESKTLEYKECLPKPTEGDVKEFLADVSSFANASGGHIIYGIKAERDEKNNTTGRPEAAIGIEGGTPDAIIQRLESVILAGIEPRLHGFQVVPVEGFDKGLVVVVRIGQSWSGPHMVKKGDSRFYSRTGSRKFALDVAQIRAAFLLSEGLAEKIRNFRDSRLARIVADDGPMPVADPAKTILHIVPLSSMAPAASVSFESFAPRTRKLQPMGTNYPGFGRFNLDGFVIYDGHQSPGPCGAYTQLFRTGIIEGVSIYLTESSNKIILNLNFERPVIKAVGDYLAAQKEMGVQPPMVVMVSLIGVKGFEMGLSHSGIVFGRTGESIRSIDRDALLLPEVIVENYEEPVAQLLHPVFDTLWQACGHEGCPYYNRDGTRKPNT